MNNTAVDAFAAEAGLVTDANSPTTLLEATLAISELGLAPGNHVLDLPCGAGRHTFALGDMGLVVTGVDIDTASLAIARRRLCGPAVEFLQMDVRDVFKLGSRFDAVVSYFSCIGYLEDEVADRAAVMAMAQTLKPGGGMLLSTANARAAAPSGLTRANYQADAFAIERTDNYDPLSGRLERRYEINDMRNGSRRLLRHTRRLYLRCEILNLLYQAGIHPVRTLGDYSGGDFIEDASPHAIYVGRRR